MLYNSLIYNSIFITAGVYDASFFHVKMTTLTTFLLSVHLLYLVRQGLHKFVIVG